MQKAKIGRIVIYRTDGRNGLDYELPAIITCTRDSHPGGYPDGTANPLPVPPTHEHVHLTVFTPGGFGTQVIRPGAEIPRRPDNSADFASGRVESIVPGSGTYVEWNVPLGNERGTWRWPVID